MQTLIHFRNIFLFLISCVFISCQKELDKVPKQNPEIKLAATEAVNKLVKDFTANPAAYYEKAIAQKVIKLLDRDALAEKGIIVPENLNPDNLKQWILSLGGKNTITPYESLATDEIPGGAQCDYQAFAKLTSLPSCLDEYSSSFNYVFQLMLFQSLSTKMGSQVIEGHMTVSYSNNIVVFRGDCNVMYSFDFVPSEIIEDALKETNLFFQMNGINCPITFTDNTGVVFGPASSILYCHRTPNEAQNMLNFWNVQSTVYSDGVFDVPYEIDLGSIIIKPVIIYGDGVANKYYYFYYQENHVLPFAGYIYKTPTDPQWKWGELNYIDPPLSVYDGKPDCVYSDVAATVSGPFISADELTATFSASVTTNATVTYPASSVSGTKTISLSKTYNAGDY